MTPNGSRFFAWKKDNTTHLGPSAFRERRSFPWPLVSYSSPSSSRNTSFFQSKLREIERKISLENAHNEELMLELALQKKQTGGGSSSLTAGGTAGTSGTAATTNSTQINNLLNQELQLAGLQGTGIGLPATTSGLFFASFFC